MPTKTTRAAKAARQARYRVHLALGIKCATVPVSNDLIGFLIDTGWLLIADSECMPKVGEAIGALLDDSMHRPVDWNRKK